MLLARLYEVFPLLCPSSGAPMRIIAFITDTPAIRQILDHIREPSTPHCPWPPWEALIVAVIGLRIDNGAGQIPSQVHSYLSTNY
jgi:hypothetical protein